MARLPKREVDFLRKLKREYGVSADNACIKKRLYKTNHEGVYNKLVYEEKLILEIQEAFAELMPKDLYKYFRCNHPAQMAYQFLFSLYSLDTSKPIHKGFIKKATRIYQEYLKDNNL